MIDSLETIAIGAVALTNRSLGRTGGEELSFEQWRAIMLVGDRDDGMRMSGVARRVGVTLPATTRLLHRLARRGLLSVDRDPADSRARLVRLTPAGRDLRHAVLEDRRDALRIVASRAGLHADDDARLEALARAFRDVGAIP